MDGELAVRVEGLVRHFEDIKAVDGVSFKVERGEIFSLLGPNGAGKSTMISMLCCLLRPSGGDAFVMGHSILKEPKEVKAAIGVVPQEIALYEDLSARENLVFWGKMYGLRGAALHKKVDEVLELIGLTDRQKGRVGKFSGGMKRRVNIGVALLHTPDVIIMDEPTVGIDPQSRRHILDGVIAFNQRGGTVLYTTHYMEEAQELSSHIAIMDQGKVIANGTHDELVQIVGEQDRIDLELNTGIDAAETKAVVEAWRGLAGVSKVTAEDASACLLVDDSNLVLPQLFEAANNTGLRITSVEIREPNLETVFLHLTGRALRD
jgi:ABC-2 type transport system ATP-binding protein